MATGVLLCFDDVQYVPTYDPCQNMLKHPLLPCSVCTYFYSVVIIFLNTRIEKGKGLTMYSAPVAHSQVFQQF